MSPIAKETDSTTTPDQLAAKIERLKLRATRINRPPDCGVSYTMNDRDAAAFAADLLALLQAYQALKEENERLRAFARYVIDQDANLQTGGLVVDAIHKLADRARAALSRGAGG